MPKSVNVYQEKARLRRLRHGDHGEWGIRAKVFARRQLDCCTTQCQFYDLFPVPGLS